MQCKICHSETKFFAHAQILQRKYNADYYECPTCQFVFIHNPHWLAEAYQESITDQDIGLLNRNLRLSIIAFAIIRFFFPKKGKYLDFAGGYGVFTRLMRNLGISFYHFDKYTSNLFAKSFTAELNEKNLKYELITAFEAFEHFENPLAQITELLQHTENLLISTELLPSSKPLPEQWHYYALDHGQHICFYSVKTFEYLAEKFNLNFYTNGNDIHLLTRKKIPKFLLKLFMNFKIALFIRYAFKYPSLQDQDQKQIDHYRSSYLKN